MKYKILIVLLFSLLYTNLVFSQLLLTNKFPIKKNLQVILLDTSFITRQDTVIYLTSEEAENVKVRANPYQTSSRFYERLSKRASHSRLTKNALELVVKKTGRKEKLVNAIVKSEDAFKPFAGLVIGSIVFKTVDLLEGSVIDTLQKASTRFGIFINKIHKDTRAIIIQHNLLFEVGDTVDPYQLADNERVLRQFKTLRDARIYVSKNKEQRNVVDVVVVTQDVGSIGVVGSLSSLQKATLEVYDINILGYARQLRVSYFRNSAGQPKNGYEITVREPNFMSTFIQGEVQYTENYLRQRTRLALARDFFTPEIKYAGGIEIYRTHEKFYFEEYDTLELPYTENNVDVWGGRSFEFKKRTNLIFSARVNKSNFFEVPFVSSDSNSFFYNRTLLLGSVTLIKRNFLKSLRIRGFGKTEDVPVGGSISILAGKEINRFIDRPYFGTDVTFGRYFSSIGYLNFSLSYGSFFKEGHTEDGLVAITSTYFSHLIRIKKMQSRQFIYFTYTNGYNRVLDRTISLVGKWHDLNYLPPLGNQRLTLGTETVYFMPWYAYGFQFALFHRVDLNLLSNGGLLNRKALFPSVRVGVRMLNENLVLPRFSVDVAYFGKNNNFNSAWQFTFSTTLVSLFGTSQIFKPTVAGFN